MIWLFSKYTITFKCCVYFLLFLICKVCQIYPKFKRCKIVFKIDYMVSNCNMLWADIYSKFILIGIRFLIWEKTTKPIYLLEWDEHTYKLAFVHRSCLMENIINRSTYFKKFEIYLSKMLFSMSKTTMKSK